MQERLELKLLLISAVISHLSILGYTARTQCSSYLMASLRRMTQKRVMCTAQYSAIITEQPEPGAQTESEAEKPKQHKII